VTACLCARLGRWIYGFGRRVCRFCETNHEYRPDFAKRTPVWAGLRSEFGWDRGDRLLKRGGLAAARGFVMGRMMVLSLAGRYWEV